MIDGDGQVHHVAQHDLITNGGRAFGYLVNAQDRGLRES